MAKVLTETSTFTATVSVPEDGDARNAASVETPFQALTNRTRDNKDRLDALDTSIAATTAKHESAARYSISGSAVSIGSYFTLAEDFDTESNFTLPSSTEVQVPAAGVYLVSVQMMVTISTAGSFAVHVELESGSIVHRMGGVSDASGALINISGSVLLNIASPSTERIKVQANSTQDITVHGSYAAKLALVRIS